MLSSQLIQTTYPVLNLLDKVAFALQLMDDYDVVHLPVTSEEKFAGMISKEELLDADEATSLAALQEFFILKSVNATEHFISAVKISAENNLSLVSIINDDAEIVGSVSNKEILATLNTFIGNEEPGGIIVLEIDRRNYSFGEISRLVETNDAYITQLNTLTEATTGLVLVTIKVNKIEISDIVATFQRFDYAVRYFFGEEQYTNELKDNYNHLMAYLNI
jgi:predicted transcriptional regulator